MKLPRFGVRVACILDVLQRGAKFVVMVRVVGIKGVRMLMEHLIKTLPERKVYVAGRRATGR